MAAGDIYEATYDLLYASQNIATVFHFVQIGSDATGDPRDSINLMFENELVTPYLLGLVDTLVSVGVRSRQIKPTQTQALTRQFTTAGTVPGDGMPPNCVGILRTYGPLLGRRGIGRIAVPAIPEEDVIKGRLNVDQLTFRDVLGDALQLDQDDGVTSWVWHAAVFSRVDNIARQINNAGMLTQLKNLRSRTRTS